MRILLVCLLSLAACSDDDAGPLTSQPLRAAGAATGDTRFERLDPAVIGLAFENELKPENILPYIYNGGGVAVGDYDQDGLPDVYLVSQDGPNKLFRQVAPWQFEDVTESAGGLDGGEAWGNAATFADVDDDGDLDLYVCNLEAPNLLYQNKGDGTFVERAGKLGLGISTSSSGAAFADFDNDGDLDLYLLTNRVLGPSVPKELMQELEVPADTRAKPNDYAPPPPSIEFRDGEAIIPKDYKHLYLAVQDQVFAGGQRDRLLRNDGYAKWTDVTAKAGIDGYGMGLSATWWDYDNDGVLDLYVANDLESPDKLYHGNGDGTFEDVTKSALPHTAYFGMGSDFGDIDNDGGFDFIVADMSSRTHYMSKMLMGNMGDRRWFLENADPPQYMRNALYLNTGTDRFMEAAYLTGLASTDWTWALRFADLDNDGRVDLFVTNGIPRFDNDPDAGPEFRRLWQLGQKQQALDFARNIPPVPEANLAFRNKGGLKFENVSASWGIDDEGVSHGAVLADLDRDGDLDVIVNNMNAPTAVYRNCGDDGGRMLVELRGDADNRFGVGARIVIDCDAWQQSRMLTLSRGYLGSGEAIAHFGTGSEKHVRLHVHWPNGDVQVFEDLATGRHYVARQGESAGAALPPEPILTTVRDEQVPGLEFVHREAAFDDYAAQPLLPHRVSRLGPGIAWGDANGDGRDDVFVGGAAGQAGQLMIAQDDGSFVAVENGPWERDAACEDMGALWFDVDSDGDLDLYVASGGVEAQRPEDLHDRIYRNDGSGAFERAGSDTLPPLAHSSSCVVGADYDRDGDLDLFVGTRMIAGRYPEPPPSTLLRNDGGKLIDATDEVAPRLRDAGLVTGAVFSDADGDGFVDLLVTAHFAPVRVFRNHAGQSFEDVTASSGLHEHLGLWNGIEAGDFDGDGDQDYVATNHGLNSKYKASKHHPMHIYAADFDDNGVLDIVEAKFEADLLLPVRGKSCSSGAMPFLADKFPTFDGFAKASLSEIYTQAALDSARELTATHLENSILVNDGAGRFELRSLPRLAQIAPGFGIAVGRFDEDRELDVVIAQNSFSPEPETGRLDGGLGVLLTGNGDATFDVVGPVDSGIVVHQDAASLGAADIDGDSLLDFVVTTNDGPLRTFLGVRGEPGLVVRLVGRAGNPTAVGARITWSQDGTERSHEVRAGSGYLSQHAPHVHVPPNPGELRVRWPDGSETTHDSAIPTGRIEIEQR